MEFTIAILELLMKNIYPLHNFSAYSPTDSFSKLEIGRSASPKPDILYLLTKADLTDSLHSEEHCIYIIENQNLLLLDTPFFLCSTDGAYTIINSILQRFWDFKHWSEQLSLLEKNNNNLRCFLAATCELLPINLNLMDNAFYMRISVGSLVTDIEYNNIANEYSPVTQEELQQLYINNPDFGETFLANGLHHYHYSDEGDILMYYYNLFWGKQPIARLLIQIKREMTGTGFEQLMSYLSKILNECYPNVDNIRLTRRHSQRLYTLLYSFLTSTVIDKNELWQLLNVRGWLINHTYRVAVLNSVKQQCSHIELQRLCIEAEVFFPWCLAIETEENVICIFNETLAPTSDSYNQLPVFLRENLCRTGISCTFNDLNNISLYVTQAKYAMKYGILHNEFSWNFYFSDYVDDYLLQKCTEEFPLKDLYHPVFAKLEEYDRIHHMAELSNTLIQYMINGCNAARTAEVLCIHRTTFHYRIQKIQKLCHINFSDWKVRLSLLVTIRLKLLSENTRNKESNSI